MMRSQEERMKVSLTEVIDKWLEGQNDLPACGYETAELMAEAGMTVLRANAALEAYYRDEDMLKDSSA